MASIAQSTSTTLPKGVAPLRAGTGNSFLWRRLHSLTGIVPVGLFLLEHFLSNAEATNGVAAYNAQVKFLTGLPFRLGLEIFGIFIPLAFHALYGVYIWWRGENNVIDYPWAGNWYYTLQRYSGLVVFAYVTYHIWYMRFAGVHLVDHSDAAFWKVQHELMHPLALAILRGGRRCRFLALRLWTLPLCRQVGHCDRNQGSKAGTDGRNRSFRRARAYGTPYDLCLRGQVPNSAA